MTRIVFFGNERLATGVSTNCAVLASLIEAGYEIAAVIASSQAANSRGLEIEEVARRHNIPLLLPDKIADLVDDIAAFRADAGVLVAFGQIIPEAIINLFPAGIINLHPSLLPLHRGPTPIESVILEGSKSTGVTIMKLANKMDAGDVYAQSEIDLSGQESKQELADKLLEIGAGMMVDLLPEILAGSIVALPQDESRATYDSKINKTDGVLDFTKPAAILEREIRAFAEWPKSHCELFGKTVIITSAGVIADDTDQKPGEIVTHGQGLKIATSGGWLAINRLKPAGKNEMSAAEFIRGLR
jgi:methionyl-tRNA formyltransferase